MAADTSPTDRSAPEPRRRHVDVDEPLFDPDLIPNAGDPRSVGELLRDVDLHARQLLFDVSGEDAAGLLRGWPPVVDAASRLWYVLPGRPVDPDLCADLDRPMARLSALTEGLTSARGFQQWPGCGFVDRRFHQIASTLVQAAELVARYGADVAPTEQRVRRDIQATRTRLMHAVYLSAHGVTVALHERSRDLREAAAAEGTPLPLAAGRSPYLVASTATWTHRMSVCERTAGAYLGQRCHEQLADEVDGAGEATDPNRVRRALAGWDIQAHRTLAAHPTPANLVLASATQARIADTTAFLLTSASASRALAATDTLWTAVEATKHAWAELESRWRDLCLPHDRLDPALAQSASEVRAAYGDPTRHSTGPTATAMLANRPGLVEAVRASVEALEASADIAQVMNEKSNDPHLTGPARALSLRAHNDLERLREAQPRRHANRDVLWVTPRDIHAQRLVPLPRPVAEGLREAAWQAMQAAGSLRGALSPTVGDTNAPTARLRHTATCSPQAVPASVTVSRQAR